jgi:GNAT superfamily N-acetyltransferase
LPGSCTGDPDPDTGLYGWLGFLAGFAVLNDWNGDGECERLTHIWTAQAARRKGVARALVAYAREHFPLKKVEQPLTDAGRALFNAVWPEVIETAITG